MGVDIGSASSKVVILENGERTVAAHCIPFGTGSSGPQRALDICLETAGIGLKDIRYTIATGYGRNSYDIADKQMSEISCHAKGVSFLVPSARTIIDIGGQDAKAIRLNKDGQLLQFNMNDKCAAGTGRFLDVMARVLEIPLSEMGAWHGKATNPAIISSTCTVFAESEVISRLSENTPKADIIAGVHRSVASKACGLAIRDGIEKDVVMSGGVALNSGVVQAISEELGIDVQVVPNPQLAGALGAALYAYKEALLADKQ